VFIIIIYLKYISCRSSNCVVTSRWTLQVTDFGLHELRNAPDRVRDEEWTISDNGNDGEVFKLLWKAPELLQERAPIRGTQKGDIYAFGIILYEICGRQGPYGDLTNSMTYEEIVDAVKNPQGVELMRPDLDLLAERARDPRRSLEFMLFHNVLQR
jgi:guanylate cyclase